MGYLCCNLPVHSEVVYTSNVLGGSVAQLGERVRIDTTKRSAYFWGYAGGTYLGFYEDVTPSSRNGGAGREWLARIVVPQDPTLTLAQWPPEVQNAVRARRVFPGMTREQVRMSLGYPSPAHVPDPATAAEWRYDTLITDDALVLRFDGSDRLAAIEGPEPAREIVRFVR